MTGGRDTLNVRLHLPESVTFDGDPAEDQQRALERVLLRAVARAATGAQEGGLPVTGMPPPAGEPPATPPTTKDPLAGAFEAEAGVGPPAGGGLQLAFGLSADVVEGTADQAEETGTSKPAPAAPPSAPAAPAPAAATAPPARTSAPAGAPAPSPSEDRPAGSEPSADGRDEVIEGPSGLEGRAVIILPGTRIVTLGGATRYVRASNLTRAVQLGRAVFGTTSFALLEGPVGAADRRIWVVATTPPVSTHDLEVAGGKVPTGQQLANVLRSKILRAVEDPAGHRYDIVTVLTKERNPLTADREAGLRLYERLAAGGPELAEEEAAQLVFGDLDRLVDQVLGGDDDRLQEAAERLAELDAEAFGLVDWRTKSRYLTVLIKAWTWESQEHAIVEIMRSLRSVTELDSVRETLATAGLATQLFEDLGDTLWDLLVAVGARFGKKEPFTVAAVGRLIEEAFQLSPEVRAAIRDNVVVGETIRLADSVWGEVEAAVGAVLGLLRGMVEGLAMLVTRPAQILEGLGQLARMVVMFQLAGWGCAPAQAECSLVVQQIGAKLADGFRGAAVLHVGEHVAARIKWALVVEVASWFVGIGELKAAAEALGLSEKLATVARFLGLVGKVAGTAEGQLLAAKLSRVARAMHAGSIVLREVEGEQEVVRLLSHLPVEDDRRLVALLERLEIAEGSTLAELLAHPELGPVVRSSLRKAEILQTLAAKAGGLGEELGQVFRHLAGPGGFEEKELAALAEALVAGEGDSFLAAVRQIGLHRIGPGAEVGIDFLTVVAADVRRMDGVREVGWRVVRVALDEAGGEVAAFDALLLEIARLQDEARRTNRIAAFSTLLEQLERGDATAWRLVAGARAVVPQVEHAAVLARIRSIRARYRGRAVQRAAMERQLAAVRRLSKKNPQLAMEIIEGFEERRLDRAGSFADPEDLAAAWDDAAKWASQDEKALLHEAGEAPPEAPGLSDTPHQPVTTGGRPSDALERNMAAAGDPRPPGHETHHIVPEGDPRAEIARRILKDAEIDVRQGAENGIHLPRTSTDPRTVPEAVTRHPTLHTDAYYKELTLRLLEAKRDHRVPETLAAIKGELKNGQFFHVEDGATRGERFADWLMRHEQDFDWLDTDELVEIIEATRRRPRATPGPAAAPPAPGSPER
ncbi:AHH domain-containing protein [Streptomyces bugieae]|uniref:AHH domain-containing protein n=1 Tax=Streptomyces bugieae TaxID=3098223 RepID=A0ABU7NMX3_9ACTN|nr:AHH domain-containing protein [Streptomyces sp. DSM 41528]